MTGIVDPSGNRALANEYNSAGRVSSATATDGQAVEIEYDPDSRTQLLRDPFGNETTQFLDTRGNIVREERPGNAITTRSFDARDNLLSETIFVGLEDAPQNGETNDLTTTHTYDALDRRTSSTDPRGNTTYTSYNTFDQPTSFVDTLGNTTRTIYDFFGRPTTLIDALRNLTHLTFDGNNVTEIHNGTLELLVAHTYNDFGDITSTTPAAGPTQYFAYDANGNRTQSWYFDGTGPDQVQVIDTTFYDALDRVIGTTRSVVEDGVTTTLWSTSTTFTALGQVATTTDQYGLVTEYTYDVRGLDIESRRQSLDEQGNTVSIITRSVYDAAGRRTLVTDPYLEGTTGPIFGTRTEYDAIGRVTRSEQRKNIDIDITNSPDGRRSVTASTGTLISFSTTAYDNAGRVTVSTDSNGLETRFTYNRFGETTETRRQSVDEAGNVVWLVTRTVYDRFGRVVLSTDNYVEGLATPTHGTRTEYDSLGRTTKTARLEGVAVGLTDGETAITDEGVALYVTQTLYDGQGRVSRTISATGAVTDYEHDALGRQVAMIHPAVEVGGLEVRHRVEKVYDSLGHVETERTGVRQLADGTIDRSEARETSFEYGEFGNLINITFDDGAFTRTRYDNFGRVVEEIDQLGNSKLLEYDGLGRLAAVELPAVPDPANNNALTRPRYEYGYNAQGQQTLIRDPLGRETRFEYDMQGRQVSRTLPLGVATLTDPNDFVERFEYDDRGRLTLHVSFEGVVARNVYDSATGRLSERKFFDNLGQYQSDTAAETWEHRYDSFGQEVAGEQVAGANVRTTTTAYDAEGRVTRITSPEGVVNYVYDALGRLTRTTTGNTAYPVGDTRYTYDELGRLKTVEVYERNNQPLATPEITANTYDLLGNLDLVALPNGVISDYVYDTISRLDKLTHYAPDGTPTTLADNPKVAEFDYDVLADGKRSGVTETFWFEGAAHTNEIDWTYDDAGRLVDEVFNHYDDALDFTAEYILDLVGNRLAKITDRGNNATLDDRIDATFDANDRLVTEAKDDLTASNEDRFTVYAYGAGNSGTQQTKKTVHEGLNDTGNVVEEATYGYNLQGRMAQVQVDSDGNGTAESAIQYEYAADGTRVSETVNGTKTLYLVDRQNATGYSQVLEEKDSSGNVLKTYTFGLEIISQQAPSIQGGATLYLLKDGHGSTRGLVDALGAPLTGQIYGYDAFGNAIGFDPESALTSRLYNSEQFDQLTGLTYLRARYYDPGAGRFNRVDPFFGNLQDPQSLHKYLFAHGDGINFNDPTGQFEGLVGLLFAANIQTIISNLDLEAARGVAGSLGFDLWTGPVGVILSRDSGILPDVVYDWEEWLGQEVDNAISFAVESVADHPWLTAIVTTGVVVTGYVLFRHGPTLKAKLAAYAGRVQHAAAPVAANGARAAAEAELLAQLALTEMHGKVWGALGTHTAHFLTSHSPMVPLPELLHRATVGIANQADNLVRANATRFSNYVEMKEIIEKAIRARDVAGNAGLRQITIDAGHIIGEGYYRNTGVFATTTRAVVRFDEFGQVFTAYPLLP